MRIPKLLQSFAGFLIIDILMGLSPQNLSAQIKLPFENIFIRQIGSGDIAANYKFLYTSVAPGIDCIVPLPEPVLNTGIP